MAGIGSFDDDGIRQLDNESLRSILTPLSGRPVSECVASFDYNLETEELTVQFNKRGTYLYSGFPLNEFVTFSQAGSLGTYFNLYIREQYPYERID